MPCVLEPSSPFSNRGSQERGGAAFAGETRMTMTGYSRAAVMWERLIGVPATVHTIAPTLVCRFAGTAIGGRTLLSQTPKSSCGREVEPIPSP